ncbi:MAG TPA: LytS/YhcK type 5TM receptor domain-containing protein, partial [Anaeromyxobacteraceae bacterium]|nr:LytS/YhcK type 5TM receptor domain-containing protein [Anaeromyxobacteraceae bacterium]
YRTDWLRPGAAASLYAFFSAISILGSYLGLVLPNGAIANTRAMGAVLAGLLGGPVLGTAVGATAGVHRITLGGITALSGAIATTLEGLAGGIVHRVLVRQRAPERIIDWKLALVVTAIGEIAHMGILLLVSRPTDEVLALIRVIGIPMIAANSAGAALFMTVLKDRQTVFDKVGAASSAEALRVAERSLEPLARGFGPDSAREIAGVIREETGAAAVALTDTETVLAFDGVGTDHHVPGNRIALPETRTVIATREAIFLDGERDPFDCTISAQCPLGSVAIAPIIADGVAIGTVQLYELRRKRFRRVNRSLCEGIADLLSRQILRTRYQEQKALLTLSELKLIQAQVNPHFLFNSLNTIVAVTRTDPERARELLAHLSHFFRKNLKRSSELSTLEEELEHVASYLEIEKARFQDRLVVETEIDPALNALRLPTFTLQPLVENAVKHGLSATMGRTTTRIRARREGDVALIEVEDDAGTFVAQPAGDGLGMALVEKRLRNLLGSEWGLLVECRPNELTRVTVRVPLRERAA